MTGVDPLLPLSFEDVDGAIVNWFGGGESGAQLDTSSGVISGEVQGRDASYPLEVDVLIRATNGTQTAEFTIHYTIDYPPM
jgi:hypothetical protein